MAIYVGNALSSGTYLGSTAVAGFLGDLPVTGVVAAETTGLVASRFAVPTSEQFYNQNTTSRRGHWASSEGAIDRIQTIDVGWYLDATTLQEKDLSTSFTIERYIEYPTGVFTQVLWGGVGTVTVAVGGVAKSDVIAGLTIPAGAFFAERTVLLSASGNIPNIVGPATNTALGLPDGKSLSRLGNSGTIAADASVNSFGSTAMVGRVAKAGARSFVLHGDSIVFGQGDITNVDTYGNSGYPARTVGSLPSMKIACPGAQAADLAFAKTRQAALLAAISYSDAIVEAGINDLRLGRTQAQILANQQSLRDLHTGKRVYQTTLTPRADSTDSYATVANQTPKTDGNMAALTAVNTSIRALTGVLKLDVADAAMSARDSNIWGGPFPPTTDGTHPTTAKAAAMASALAIAIAS